MCLTAKPTVECTLSTVQTEPAGMWVCGVVMALMTSVSGIKWTVVRLLAEGKVAHETDCGPVILPDVFAPLPQIDAEPPERADAARNRERVLGAAARLFATHGPDCVTMEAVAAEAGVGKGTVFRRFGDRAGLARAILSEPESKLQEAMIRGPAPLGPGAPPVQRLGPFRPAHPELLHRHAPLLFAPPGTPRTR